MNEFKLASSSETVELSQDEESMACTAAIFVVRCSYQLFKYTAIIWNSDITSVMNCLPFNRTDKVDTVRTKLHYAIDIYSSSFQYNSCITFSKTKIKIRGLIVLRFTGKEIYR